MLTLGALSAYFYLSAQHVIACEESPGGYVYIDEKNITRPGKLAQKSHFPISLLRYGALIG